MSTPAALIDTKRVQRRELRFRSLDDLEAELSRIESAERRGVLRTLGNWTPGQILGHLATWVGFTYEGNPLRPPWLIRMVLKGRKGRYLGEGLPAGVRIPKVPGGTLGTDPLPFDEGLVRYRTRLEQLRRETPVRPNVIFGPLTHEEWIRLHLRHAELHLGFLTY
jgi:hypothetical protein